MKVRKDKFRKMEKEFLLNVRFLSTSIIVSLFLSFGTLYSQTQQHKQHSFKNAERWAKVFEDPERDEWQNPTLVIKSLRLRPNATVADIGSGTGYFSVRFAKAVPRGKVIGVDIEKDMVDYLNNRAKEESITNLISVLGSPDDPKIPEPVDLIFICNTYHHIEQRVEYFTDLKKSFRKRGKLAIVDFVKGDIPVGPPNKDKISPETVIEELREAGYTLIKKVEGLPYQYMLIFTPSQTGSNRGAK